MKRLRRFLQQVLGSGGGPRLLAGTAAVLLSFVASSALAAGGGGHVVPLDPHVNWWTWDSHAPPVGYFFINFFIFVAALVYFVKKPLAAAMLKRHTTVKHTIAENEAQLAKAQRQFEDTKGKLAHVEKESTELVERSKADGIAEREQIVESAHDYANRMRHDATQILANESVRAAKRLQLETARAALAAAEQMLARGMTDADRQRLFEQAIDELERGDATTTRTNRKPGAPESTAGGAP